jgi:ADP-ribosylglycohydrolase
MYGAIIGDIIGSPYEWHPIKTKEFPLFSPASRFTDDTVTTVAISAALVAALDRTWGYTQFFADELRKWCRLYPGIGYGRYFENWVHHDDAEPYGSYGNGAAMRVSPVAWAAESLQQAQYLAELSAVVTHDQIDAVKGAVAVASVIYLGRIGQSKEDIRAYVQRYFYPLQQTVADIRRDYRFDSSSQGSVPQAITAFLESSNFEDALRNAVSLGGDSDTLATMAGSMAEGFYGGIPIALQHEAVSRLPDDIKEAASAFRRHFTCCPCLRYRLEREN